MGLGWRYIPPVIFALVMLALIRKDFLRKDGLLIVLAAITRVAIALFLSFLHTVY